MNRLPFWMAVVTSIAIHLGALYAWQQREVAVPSALAVQTVTVELLALTPPAGAIEHVAPSPTPAESPPAPDALPEPLPDENPVVEKRVAEKPLAIKKQARPQAPKTPSVMEKRVETRPQAAASADLPTPEAVPAPAPLSAARYDANYLRNPPPAYPPLSRRLGEEGRVLLRVNVTSAGEPAVVDIAKSSGFARLDQAARKAVLHWRFVPAKQGETAVGSWVEVPVQFSLSE